MNWRGAFVALPASPLLDQMKLTGKLMVQQRCQ